MRAARVCSLVDSKSETLELLKGKLGSGLRPAGLGRTWYGVRLLLFARFSRALTDRGVERYDE